MSEFQAVLFDLDGVLADSEPMWNEIDGALLAEYGVTYGGEYKHVVLGKSFQLALQFYKDTFNVRAEVEEMALRRTQIATDFYARRIPMFAEAPVVLRQLRDAGLKIGLASSSVRALVVPFLERHDLKKYFHALTTGEEVERGKPNPDIYLRAAQKVEVEPRYCLVVEDALSGVAAGKSAGMTVVAIPDARFVDPALYVERADALLARLAELPEWMRAGRPALMTSEK